MGGEISPRKQILNIVDLIIVQISSEIGCVIRFNSPVSFVVHVRVSVSEW
jgi:hypothetical protein